MIDLISRIYNSIKTHRQENKKRFCEGVKKELAEKKMTAQQLKDKYSDPGEYGIHLKHLKSLFEIKERAELDLLHKVYSCENK